MFGSFDISASAMHAQRTRLETVMSNIANVDTVMKNGRPDTYRRLYTVFEAQRTAEGGAGVRVKEIREDMGELIPREEPDNPAADPKTGLVWYPNVDLGTEIINAMESTRAYEANVTAVEATKSMMNATLRMIG